MNVLLHLMVALLVSGLAESGARLTELPSWTNLWGVPWTALLWPIAAWPLARLTRLRMRQGAVARGVGRLATRLLGVWPIVAHAGAVMVSGWLDIVDATALPSGEPRRDWLSGTLADWPVPALALLFAPFALAVLAAADAALCAAYRGVFDRVQFASIRRAVFKKELRLLAVAATPLFVLALLDAALHRSLDVSAMLEEVALLEWLDALVLIALFGAFLPALLRLALGLRRVPSGRLVTMFDDIARRLGFRGRGLFLWRTGGTEINAAVVGFAKWHRFVLVTDGLAAEVPADEARALFGHEMGHTVRRHVALFIAFTSALFVPIVIVLQHSSADSALALWLPFALLAVWYFGFGWLSRRAELDADLVALEMAGGPGPLERLLARTASPSRRHKNGWRHFGPAQRAVFARAAHRHVEVGLRLRRTLARVRQASTVAAVFAVLALLFSGAQSFRADLTRANLRSGSYGAALERAADVDGPLGARFADLARTATRMFGPGAGDTSTRVAPQDLESAAQSALQRRDFGLAEDLLELARWRSGGALGDLGRSTEAGLGAHFRTLRGNSP